MPVRFRMFSIFLIACCLPALAASQTIKEKENSRPLSGPQCTNGCGPDGWMGDFIPNAALGCNFKSSCDKHDVCYGRCDGTNCPERLSAAECPGKCGSCDRNCPPKRRLRRERCDEALEANIVKANNGSCVLAAYAYRMAVSALGCLYFNGFAGETSDERKARLKRTFRRSFETAYQRAEADPSVMQSQTVSAETKALRTVGEVADITDQPLVLDKSQKPPTLAFQAGNARFAPPSERVYLNGVDVTDVMVRGRPFDLRSIKKERPDLDTSRLTQEKVDR